jgi:Domain of unknown function (DUF4405)
MECIMIQYKYLFYGNGNFMHLSKMKISRFRLMLCLDILLFVSFILLFSPLITGLAWHELLGLMLFLPVIFHLLFSWAWIRQSTRRFLHHADWRNRFNYCLNATLFSLIILEIVSGLAISQIALPFIGIKTINDWVWRALHNQASGALVLTVSLHIALNWQRIIGYFKKRGSGYHTGIKKYLPSVSAFIRGSLRVLLILLVAGIITTVAYLIIGAPTKTRINFQNEIARFSQKLVPGIVQVTGGIITIAILTYMAHRWLKLKL